MTRIFTTAVFVSMAQAALAQDTAGIPAQTFRLDPSHSSVTFEINHIGLTEYTAGFDTIAATLFLDPADPATARLSAQIEVGSLDLPAPPDGFADQMLGPAWLNMAAYPVITYESETVTLTGEDTARIDGTLTLLGTSAPVTLLARFGGSYAAGRIEPFARIGFSASGTFDRSDFGMTIGLPPDGSTLGVGDAITVRIQAEFTGDPAVQ
jgi:polyisoprenoid-binding protein YceI